VLRPEGAAIFAEPLGRRSPVVELARQCFGRVDVRPFPRLFGIAPPRRRHAWQASCVSPSRAG